MGWLLPLVLPPPVLVLLPLVLPPVVPDPEEAPESGTT